MTIFRKSNTVLQIVIAIQLSNMSEAKDRFENRHHTRMSTIDDESPPKRDTQKIPVDQFGNWLRNGGSLHISVGDVAETESHGVGIAEEHVGEGNEGESPEVLERNPIEHYLVLFGDTESHIGAGSGEPAANGDGEDGVEEVDEGLGLLLLILVSRRIGEERNLRNVEVLREDGLLGSSRSLRSLRSLSILVHILIRIIRKTWGSRKGWDGITHHRRCVNLC